MDNRDASLESDNMSKGAWMNAALKQYADVYGENSKNQWISTPYDTWEKNPHYVGPDQPHPEDDLWMYEDEDHVPVFDDLLDMPF